LAGSAGDDATVVRIGLLGAAWIAPRAIVEPARQVPETELVGVACRDPATAEVFASQHDIPMAYNSYAELIEDESLDAVFIALVNSHHAPWTIAALEAGRHVLCEKPLGANADDARDMVAASERTGRVLVEAFHWRFHPLASRVIELSRRIGPLRRAVAHAHQNVAPENVRYRLDLAGGVLMDLGCYPVHWLRTIAGEEPQIKSATATEGPPGIDLTMEAELLFPGGLEASIDCSMVDKEASLPGSAWLHLEGADGVLDVVNLIASHVGNRITGRLEDGSEIDESVDGGPTYLYQLQSFVRTLDGVERPVTGGGDSIGNMATIDAIYAAAGMPLRQSQRVYTGR
jgi:predicted dehydrogenase